MAEEAQAKPIPTLITENIAQTLSQVRVEQGYGVSLIVERLNADNHEGNNPRHLLTVIEPNDPRKLVGDGETEPGLDEYTRTYEINVWIMPSQLDGKPIDETIDAVVAAVIKALCGETNDPSPLNRTRGGYAFDTSAGDPKTFLMPDSLAYVVTIPIDVRYTTLERDLYFKG